MKRLSVELPTLNEIKAERARRGLLEFTKYTYPNYEVNWHHRELCKLLDCFVSGQIKRLMVFMPPRHGKSQLVSRHLPAFILGKNPDAEIISASYSSDLASRMNRDVQRIIDAPEYAELFTDTQLFGANVRTVAKGSYLRNSDIFEVVGHKGVYRSAGIGGGITGMGFKYGIIDDPIKNRAEAESKTYRDNIYNWYTSTFYTRQEKDAGILITLTRWHEDDLAGRLLQAAKNDPEADQWTIINFSAILDGQKAANDPREQGEALWSGKYDLENLKKIKATVGSYEWSALYQQNPTPSTGGIFNRGWWQFYKIAPARFDKIIQSWDCTFKDSAGTDYVVGQVWGQVKADKYLLDQVRARMDFPATLNAIRSLSAKWPQAREKLIEDKANGPAVIATLKREISGLIPVNPEGGKVVRAQAASPDVEAGNVYLPHPSIAPWIHDFVEEFAAFPNGTHDDQVDCMSQAFLRLQTSSGFNFTPIFTENESKWR